MVHRSVTHPLAHSLPLTDSRDARPCVAGLLPALLRADTLVPTALRQAALDILTMGVGVRTAHARTWAVLPGPRATPPAGRGGVLDRQQLDRALAVANQLAAARRAGAGAGAAPVPAPAPAAVRPAANADHDAARARDTALAKVLDVA